MNKNELMCKHFNQCGGCFHQNQKYEEQLNHKKELITKEFKKQKLVLPSKLTIVSKNPYHYRNRMDFTFTEQGLGLRKRGKFNEIVKINECNISNKKLNLLLKEINKWFESNKNKLTVFDIKSKNGCLRYAVIRTPEKTDDSTISFVVNKDEPYEETLKEIKLFAKKSSAKNIIVTKVSKNSDVSISEDYEIIKGNDWIEENLLEKKFFFHSQSFFQNNTVMAEKMIKHVSKKIKPKKGRILIDLFGGVGSFGVSLAEKFDKVLVIECVKESIECAEKNIKQNKIKNMKTLCIDATKILETNLIKEYKNKDVYVITDPPRAGMHKKTLKFLLQLKPKKIIYISCNPKQMITDINLIKGYYELKDVILFDLFPQTDHVEAISELKVKNKKHNTNYKKKATKK